jgi:hypothetical protein
MIDLKGENSAENNLTDILNAASEASSSLLPVKSKERYEKHKMVGCYAVKLPITILSTVCT